jgi:very-short-patch-repair endonuclease
MAAGELWRLTSEVFAFAGAPLTDEQFVLAACLHLGPGAVASHWTAAALWGFPGFRLVPIHVMDARIRRNAADYSQFEICGRPVVVHTSRYLPDHHVARLGVHRLVTPTRLFFQMAEVGLHPKRVERMVDRGWSRRLTSGLLLSATFDELDRPGRLGLPTMKGILLRRGPDYVPPDSNLEARAMELLDRYDFVGYRRQVNLGDEESWLARVDFVKDRRPVVLEVDGDAYHLALVDQEADAARDARLIRAGYEVVHMSDFETWHDPDPAMARLDAAERRAERRLSRPA